MVGYTTDMLPARKRRKHGVVAIVPKAAYFAIGTRRVDAVVMCGLLMEDA